MSLISSSAAREDARAVPRTVTSRARLRPSMRSEPARAMTSMRRALEAGTVAERGARYSCPLSERVRAVRQMTTIIFGIGKSLLGWAELYDFDSLICFEVGGSSLFSFQILPFSMPTRRIQRAGSQF